MNDWWTWETEGLTGVGPLTLEQTDPSGISQGRADATSPMK